MSAGAWKLGVVGLGALALSCAGVQLGNLSTASGAADTAAALIDTGMKTALNFSECDNLKSKVSFEEERALGGAVALNWVTGGGGLLLSEKSGTPPKLTPEEALQDYVNVVGRNLAAQSSRPTLPWTFGVLKTTKAFNATSAPGGYVFVTRGLLKDVQNEAQLAGVLAHEIAHVTLHHALTQYDDVKVDQCQTMATKEGIGEGVQRTGVDLTPDWLDAYRSAMNGKGVLDLDRHSALLGHLTGRVVEKLVTKGYAKDDEYAADEQAVRLLVSAGYDPREYIAFLGRLPKGDSNFAHHPETKERQKRLNNLLAKPTQKEGEFPELPVTDDLKKPDLPPTFAIARSDK